MTRDQPSDLYARLPLSATQRNIRVLDLQPGKSSSALKGTLRRIFLPDIHDTIRNLVLPKGVACSYEALSYVWGPLGGTQCLRTIRLNKHNEITIRDNLYAALKRLRKRRDTRTLWIDALCINQADLNERQAQVAIMGDIYRRAECVNIWLGDAPTLSSLLATGRPWTILLGLLGSDTRRSIAKMGWMLSHTSTDCMWESRAWVVQEYCLAQRTYFCVGRSRKQIQCYHHVYASKLMGILRSWETSVSSQGLSRTGDQAVSKGKSCFYDMTCTRDNRGLRVPRKCTDPRDLLYSVLSLASKLETDLVRPDYRMERDSVFAIATIACIESRQDFSVLRHLVRPAKSSWVMDFQARELQDKLPGKLWEPQRTAAVFGGQIVLSYDVASGHEELKLTIRTIRLDSVAHVLRLLLDNEHIRSHKRTLKDFLYAQLNERDTVWRASRGSPIYQRLGYGRGDDAKIPLPDYKGQDQPADLSDPLEPYSIPTLSKHENREYNMTTELLEICSLYVRVAGYTSKVRDSLRAANYSFAPRPPFGTTLTIFTTSAGMLGMTYVELSGDEELFLVPNDNHAMIARKRGECCSFCGFAWIYGLSSNNRPDISEQELEALVEPITLH